MSDPKHSLDFYWRSLSQGRFNGDLRAFKGWEVQSAMTPGGQLFQAVVLGPHNRGKRLGGKAKALELSADPSLAPEIRKDWVVNGEVDDSGDEIKIVRLKRPGIITRIVRTGVLSQADVAQVIRGGRRPRWHGIFPLQPGSAKILLSGEGEDSLTFDITGEAKIKSEEGWGKIKGMSGPMVKDTTVETPEGGAFYSGYLGGELEIQSLRNGEMVIYDVTHDRNHQRDFETYIEIRMKMEREEAEEAARAKAAAKAVAPTKLPQGHPDA
jgi:hypothetical protein